MELNSSSKFLQVTDYAMLEYRYDDTVINTKDADFIRILNVSSGVISYLNYNASNYDLPKKLTGNVLDYSCQPIDENKWVKFDQNRPLSYYEQNDAIFFQPIYLGRTTEINVVYDSIKIHIVSGYNFENISGFLIKAAYLDIANQKQVNVANIAYLKEDTHINFNTFPILLGDRIYDRYIEVKIPSLKSIRDSELQTKDIFQATITYGNIVYSNLFDIPDYNNSKINITFYEVYDYGEGFNGQIEIKTALPLGNDSQGIVRREILHYDTFANLVAVVQESNSGDYFEILPTYNGNFIEDFIADQSRLGHNYVGIHDIELYEQVTTFGDYDEILTHKQSFFQDSGFDNVFKFRPVIENTNAVTFTIEYTFRLLDKTDNSQIIRRATYTYPNATKYGRYMQKLNIPTGFQPMKIVNKIVKNTDKFTNSNVYNVTKNNNLLQTSSTSVVVPFQYKDICINSYTLFVDSTNQANIKTLFESTPNTLIDTNKVNFKDFISSNIIFGQGDCKLFLNNYDNFIKFKVYKYIDRASGVPEVYKDLKSSNNLNFYIIFQTTNGEEIRINEFSKVENLNIQSEEDGVLIFKINAIDSQKIINTATDQFFITIENKISGKVTGTDAWNTKKDFEVVLYNGKWDRVNNFTQFENVDYNLKATALNNLVNNIETTKNQLIKLNEDYSSFLNGIKDTNLQENQKNILDDFNKRWNDYLEQSKII